MEDNYEDDFEADPPVVSIIHRRSVTPMKRKSLDSNHDASSNNEEAMVSRRVSIDDNVTTMVVECADRRNSDNNNNNSRKEPLHSRNSEINDGNSLHSSNNSQPNSRKRSTPGSFKFSFSFGDTEGGDEEGDGNLDEFIAALDKRCKDRVPTPKLVVRSSGDARNRWAEEEEEEDGGRTAAGNDEPLHTDLTNGFTLDTVVDGNNVVNNSNVDTKETAKLAITNGFDQLEVDAYGVDNVDNETSMMQYSADFDEFADAEPLEPPQSNADINDEFRSQPDEQPYTGAEDTEAAREYVENDEEAPAESSPCHHGDKYASWNHNDEDAEEEDNRMHAANQSNQRNAEGQISPATGNSSVDKYTHQSQDFNDHDDEDINSFIMSMDVSVPVAATQDSGEREEVIKPSNNDDSDNNNVDTTAVLGINVHALDTHTECVHHGPPSPDSSDRYEDDPFIDEEDNDSNKKDELQHTYSNAPSVDVEGLESDQAVIDSPTISSNPVKEEVQSNFCQMPTTAIQDNDHPTNHAQTQSDSSNVPVELVIENKDRNKLKLLKNSRDSVVGRNKPKQGNSRGSRGSRRGSGQSDHQPEVRSRRGSSRASQVSSRNSDDAAARQHASIARLQESLQAKALKHKIVDSHELQDKPHELPVQQHHHHHLQGRMDGDVEQVESPTEPTVPESSPTAHRNLMHDGPGIFEIRGHRRESNYFDCEELARRESKTVEDTPNDQNQEGQGISPVDSSHARKVVVPDVNDEDKDLLSFLDALDGKAPAVEDNNNSKDAGAQHAGRAKRNTVVAPRRTVVARPSVVVKNKKSSVLEKNVNNPHSNNGHDRKVVEIHPRDNDDDEVSEPAEATQESHRQYDKLWIPRPPVMTRPSIRVTNINADDRGVHQRNNNESETHVPHRGRIIRPSEPRSMPDITSNEDNMAPSQPRRDRSAPGDRNHNNVISVDTDHHSYVRGRQQHGHGPPSNDISFASDKRAVPHPPHKYRLVPVYAQPRRKKQDPLHLPLLVKSHKVCRSLILDWCIPVVNSDLCVYVDAGSICVQSSSRSV
jgi:hypothetical protein